jgi:hypothetical protein
MEGEEAMVVVVGRVMEWVAVAIQVRHGEGTLVLREKMQIARRGFSRE